MLERVVLVIISQVWRTSVRVGVGRGFGEVCGTSGEDGEVWELGMREDRKSTRLNSSH